MKAVVGEYLRSYARLEENYRNVTLNTQSTTHSHQRLTVQSFRQVLLSGICCQFFQKSGRRNQPPIWKGFEQLRVTHSGVVSPKFWGDQNV